MASIISSAEPLRAKVKIHTFRFACRFGEGYALSPKADMCGAVAHVREGPIADIVERVFRILLQARLTQSIEELAHRVACVGHVTFNPCNRHARMQLS